MGRYFDYNDWDIEYLCNHIRERINESKSVIPPKVKKQGIYITFKVGDNTFQSTQYFSGRDFKSRKEAEDLLNKTQWIEKIGENSWKDEVENRTYATESGEEVPYHFEIVEYEYEQYEDGEDYIEYSEDEVKNLKEALYLIEKARVYMEAYDYCSDEYCFGKGGFTKELNEKLEKFEKEYTEELPDYECPF